MFFVILDFFVSLDFGFVKEKRLRIRILLKLFTFAKCMLLILFSIYLITSNKSPLFLIICLAEYITVVLILIYHNKFNTFSAFLKRIYLLDDEMNVNVNLTALKMIICFILCVIFRCIVIIVLCFLTESCTILNTLFPIVYQSMVIVSIFVYSVLLNLVYARLKNLKYIIQQSLCTISRGLLLYKYLVDALDEAKHIFQRLVSINTYKWMILFPPHLYFKIIFIEYKLNV